MGPNKRRLGSARRSAAAARIATACFQFPVKIAAMNLVVKVLGLGVEVLGVGLGVIDEFSLVIGMALARASTRRCAADACQGYVKEVRREKMIMA